MIGWDVRREAYRRLVGGASHCEVAADLGVGHAVVQRWVTLAGMDLQARRWHGVDPFRPVRPGKSRRYRRLTFTDRTAIEVGLASGWSIRRIAAHVGVSPSTVSREVRRHLVTTGVRPGTRDDRYCAEGAQYRSSTIAQAPRAKKLHEPVLRALVVGGLNHHLSPEQIAGRLRVDYPQNPELHVSHETIYQALYVQGKGSLRHELAVVKAIRSGRTSRKPASKLPRRTNRPWLEGALISERPAIIEDRAVPGHWEGDLVVGPANSGLVTLVERQTRFALIARLPATRDSTTVIDVLTGLIKDLPSQLRATLTWDQGQEMAQHARLSIATGCKVFFCDPHSPWQRGSNENLNGLIRDFYPKGTNFNRISDDEIAHMQHLLNTRPRETLAFRTPAEKLDELINGVALTT